NASTVLEKIHKRTPRGGLKPGSMVESRVVVTDGGVITAATDLKVAAGLVGNLHSLNIQSPGISWIGTDDYFAKKAHLFGEPRRKEEIEFTNLEGVVDRRRERKNEGIGVRAKTQIEVRESSDFQNGTTARELHGMFGQALRGSLFFRLRRWCW